MADSNDGETDAGSQVAPMEPAQTATQDGSPDLVAWVRTTLESPEHRPNWMSTSSGDDAAQIAALPAGEDKSEVEHQSESSDRRLIYVDYSTPAVLSHSETITIHCNLREAITAWLLLPNGTKEDASITTSGNGESRYQGWEIYRLWGRWDS